MYARGSEYEPAESEIARALRNDSYLVRIAGATHYSFTDLPVLLQLAGVASARAMASSRPPGSLRPSRTHEVLSGLILVFLDHYLRGGPARRESKPDASVLVC